MGWENVVAGDGVGLSLTGMFMVFSGLVLISLFIASIPRVLERIEAAQNRVARSATMAAEPVVEDLTPAIDADEALLVAIGCALHLELEFLRASDVQRITIKRDEGERNWAIVGKMRTLSTRM